MWRQMKRCNVGFRKYELIHQISVLAYLLQLFSLFNDGVPTAYVSCTGSIIDIGSGCQRRIVEDVERNCGALLSHTECSKSLYATCTWLQV
jgi:hypothetical protein